MKAWLNKHFGFSKSEFNGLLLLIILIATIRSIPIFYNLYRYDVPYTADMLTAIQKISFEDEQREYYNSSYLKKYESRAVAKLFYFDPNTIDVEAWQTLGLSPKQAQSIVNYRNKGGHFYKAHDLQKMYTISPQMYQKLLPYVRIESQFEQSSFKNYAPYDKKEYIKKPLAIIEINQADSAQLNEIKGIGPAFAMRILTYRERLGGFYKKEQLMEVYGLDSVKFNEIKDQIVINASVVKKINVNQAVFDDFKKCPYLTYKQMNAIIQYRKQHGSYGGFADLKNVAILDAQTLDKIMPYISF